MLRPRMVPPSPLALVFAALALLTICHPARAQRTEYRMDAAGNWVETRSPEPESDEAVLAQARRALAEDRPGQAKAIIDPWIERYDRTTNPFLAQALVIRGDAMTASGDEFNALYDYERVIKEFPASDQYITAIERELDIAVRYVNGLRRKFLGVRVFSNEDIGEELLIRVQERLPGSRLAERAGIELADYYYANHELSLAAEAYDLFVQNYPNSQYAMKARQRRIYSTIGRYKGPGYDGSTLLDSRILVQRFSNRYPAEAQSAGLDDALLVRLDESGAQQLFSTAQWYIKRGDNVAAQYVFKRLIREHPRTASAGRALDILQARGWAVPARPASAPPLKTPTGPTEEFPGPPPTDPPPPPTDESTRRRGVTDPAPNPADPGPELPTPEPRR